MKTLTTTFFSSSSSSLLLCFVALEFKIHIVTSCKWAFTRNLSCQKKRKVNAKSTVLSQSSFSWLHRGLFRQRKKSRGRSRNGPVPTLLAAAGPPAERGGQRSVTEAVIMWLGSSQQCEGPVQWCPPPTELARATLSVTPE